MCLAATTALSTHPPAPVARAITSSLLEGGPAIQALCAARYGLPHRPASAFDGNAGMNASQVFALGTATSSRLSLVQGPPGTGKTAVAVQIVSHWVRSRAFRDDGVLCCSDSNIAVDNLLEVRHQDIIRI